MPKVSSLMLVVVLLGGGAWFFQHFNLEGLSQLKVKPKDPTKSIFDGGFNTQPASQSGDKIRIATFNIQVFGESKMSKPDAMGVIVDVARHFDLIAIQEVRANTQDILPRFVDMINASGVRYDFVIGERLGRSNSKEQYAYVFNTATIEIDRSSVYTVADPDDLLHREPLVAGFRARGPPPEQAFTFSLVNIHTDPDEAQKEVDVLATVFRNVRNDGRGEDDIILLGDLNADEKMFRQISRIPNISWIVHGETTNTRRNKTYDNIIFDRVATTEFTGRGGVLDLMQQYNLTIEQALIVSDHFPVWAEFYTFEGGRSGDVTAARPTGPTLR